MAVELIRDTTFGKFLRIISGGKLLKYEEERDSSIWKKYVNHDKSHNLALHGQPEPPQENNDQEDQQKSNSDDPEKENDFSDNAEQSAPIKQRSGSDQTLNGEEQANATNSELESSEKKHELTGTPIDAEKGKDIHLVDWYSKDDPENPQHWSLFKKCFVTAQLCLLTLGVYIGSAIYSSGELGVMEQFGVSQEVATLGLTLFVAGYGVGPMLWSPMSEIPQIGRNPIYIGTLAVFVVFQLGCIYASNIGMLLAFRFLTGFFGSPVLATGGASLSDIWSPKKRAYAIGIWGLFAICGPVLGPLVGGFAAEAKGWQWTIWELMWLSGFALIVLFFFLPETSSMNILYRRSRRLRKLTGNEKLTSEGELMSSEMSGKDIVLMTLIRPFTLNLEPIVFLLNLYIALIYALLYCWFESFQIVFVEMYGFSLGLEGLSYLGILIGAFVVCPLFFVYMYYVLEPQFDENGDVKPEKRIPPAFVGAFCIPICLFWFGWTARAGIGSPYINGTDTLYIHWIVPIIGSSFFTIGAFLLFNSVLNYLPDAYPQYAASVLAGNDLFRSAFGAGFPLFATQMYTKLGVGGASSLLGGLAILFIPIPFFLYKYGEQIRMRSKSARHDI